MKSEIRGILENGSISEKINLIELYDIDNYTEREYVVDYIKKESIRPIDDWLKISLIDLATRLKINDIKLLNNYLSYLGSGYSYYLKLTVLDYVGYMYETYKNEKIDYSFIEALLSSNYDRLVVKIQASLILILIYPGRIIFYMERIKKYLKRSEDYRAHIRLYNSFMNIDYRIPKSYIEDLMLITEQKSLSSSKAVKSTLVEMKRSLV